MSIPKYFEMYQSFLRALSDGGVHPYADVKKQVVFDSGLSDEDVAALLPSGKQTIFNNRIGWCRTYLKKAGLIESPALQQFSGAIPGSNGQRLAELMIEYESMFIK